MAKGKKNGSKFNANQPHGEIYGGGLVKYEQNGKLYDSLGEEVVLGVGEVVGIDTVEDGVVDDENLVIEPSVTVEAVVAPEVVAEPVVDLVVEVVPDMVVEFPVDDTVVADEEALAELSAGGK